jgi:hypothetical protein
MGIIKRTFFIPALLFFLVVAVGVLLVPRIGPAWDEPDNIFSGGQYYNFFRQGLNPKVFDNTNPSSYFGDVVYPLDRAPAHLPPVANYVGTAITLMLEKSGMPHAGTTAILGYHLMTVLFFAILVTVTYVFGMLFGLPVWVSVFAALATFLYPTLFGHGLSDSKDTAQAALFTLSLYFFVKGVKRSSTRNLLAGALVWGLGLATKFNAVYVPVILGLWCISRAVFFGSGGIKFRYIYYIALGLIVSFAVWPYLWYAPLSRIGEVVNYFTHVGQGYKFFFGGKSYQSGAGIIYWWYPWASLLLCTPIPLLLSAGYGLFALIRRLKQHGDRVILIFWIMVPMARALLPGAALYDQLRHFVEILPAFMLLAGIGIESLAKCKKAGRPIAAGAALFVILSLAVINVKYFPYSAGYYNPLAGNANANFDREIEGLSIKEGIDYLHRTYGPISLWVTIAGHLSWYHVQGQDRYVYTAEEADSLIVINKRSHFWPGDDAPVMLPFRVDYAISRGEAVFAWVYRK